MNHEDPLCPLWFGPDRMEPFGRPIGALLRFGFEAGVVVDGIEEPGFPEATARAGSAGATCAATELDQRQWPGAL
jgi:hypothetical protein